MGSVWAPKLSRPLVAGPAAARDPGQGGTRPPDPDRTPPDGRGGLHTTYPGQGRARWGPAPAPRGGAPLETHLAVFGVLAKRCLPALIRPPERLSRPGLGRANARCSERVPCFPCVGLTGLGGPGPGPLGAPGRDRARDAEKGTSPACPSLGAASPGPPCQSPPPPAGRLLCQANDVALQHGVRAVQGPGDAPPLAGQGLAPAPARAQQPKKADEPPGKKASNPARARRRPHPPPPVRPLSPPPPPPTPYNPSLQTSSSRPSPTCPPCPTPRSPSRSTTSPATGGSPAWSLPTPSTRTLATRPRPAS